MQENQEIDSQVEESGQENNFQIEKKIEKSKVKNYLNL